MSKPSLKTKIIKKEALGKKMTKNHIKVEPDYSKDDTGIHEKEGNLGKRLSVNSPGSKVDPKKKSMTPETTVKGKMDGEAPGNEYFLHVLYSKGDPGEQEHLPEIIKMKHDSTAEHPKDQVIHKFIQDHPITKIHQKNGFNYHFAIGSPNDDPARMQELMQLASKNNKSKEHKTKIWEEVASDLTDSTLGEFFGEK